LFVDDRKQKRIIPFSIEIAVIFSGNVF